MFLRSEGDCALIKPARNNVPGRNLGIDNRRCFPNFPDENKFTCAIAAASLSCRVLLKEGIAHAQMSGGPRRSHGDATYYDATGAGRARSMHPGAR